MIWNKCLIVLLICTGALAQRTQWCETREDDDHDHDHSHEHEEEEVYPDDFLYEIFQLYGDNDTCTISEHEFEHLLADMSLGEDAHDHEDHSRRRRREVDHSCYTAHELLDIYNVSHSEGITEDDFIQIASGLVQQAVQGCVHEDHEESSNPSAGETYGYGTVAVIFISLCAPLGLIVVRWAHTPAYKYIMATMLALAVGTLAGDAIMHLLPHGLGLHNHDDHDHDHDHGDGVEEFVWKTFLTCIAIWGFFVLQGVLQIITGGHSHSHDVPETNKVIPEPIAPIETVVVPDGKTNNGFVGDANGIAPKQDTASTSSFDSESGNSAVIKSDRSLALMVTVGDGFHNFADGMAIGAAFTIDWQTGLSTSIAVLIHELAHEFGDVAALLSTGINWKRVFVIQLLTQTPALIGLYIGIPIAESSESAQQWILCLAAGMFLYIALCDIVPELMKSLKSPSAWKLFGFMNLGLGIGFGIMLLISCFEGAISI